MKRGRTRRADSSRLLWLAACALCLLFWAAVIYWLVAR
jgi:hypothetical protein